MKIKNTARVIGGAAILALLVPAFIVTLNRHDAGSRPNVLFIVIDTLRSDHVGCYGYPSGTTPHMDALAGEGARFENVISQVPLTLPSHCCIFTSTYPQFNKVPDNGNYKLDKRFVTLAERLLRAGYRTAAFVSTMVLDSRYGLARGFEAYDDKMEKADTKRKTISFMDAERRAGKTTDAALAWLKTHKDERFFLWVHYYDPHTPYDPPSPYKERFPLNPYDGEVAFADEQAGIVLDELKNLGLENNTLVIFLSDHGEAFGEHGEDGHGLFLYDTTLKVPLIFRYPGAIPAGKTVRAQVRLVDVMPTILDLLRIPKHRGIQGSSLLPLIVNDAAPAPRPAYSESSYGKFHFNWQELKSWRDKGWKYIESSEPELYNIIKDPGEAVNLEAAQGDVREGMAAEMGRFFKKTSSVAKISTVEIDKATREKLMSLGYIQGVIDTGVPGPVPLKMIAVSKKLHAADDLSNKGSFDQAIALYHEIVAQDQNNLTAYVHLAQAYEDARRYDEAIKYFRKAASLKPDDVDAHNGLGAAYRSTGRAKEALDEFTVALALEPENPRVLANMGWCHQQMGEMDKAMEYYDKAMAIDDSISTAYANIGIIYRVRGRLDDAIQMIEKAMALDPTLAFAYSELGACMWLKGDRDAAIAYCKKAIELDPGAFEGYNNLGVIYERSGEYEKAVENYLKALKLVPWNDTVHNNLGSTYMKMGRPGDAEKHLKTN